VWHSAHTRDRLETDGLWEAEAPLPRRMEAPVVILSLPADLALCVTSEAQAAKSRAANCSLDRWLLLVVLVLVAK
jgi:hypothetical protein